MSRITAIFGSDDDEEIMNDLYLIANVRVYIFANLYWVLKFWPEHYGTWTHSRVAKYPRLLRLHAPLVCMGKQLFCGNDPRSC